MPVILAQLEHLKLDRNDDVSAQRLRQKARISTSVEM